MFIKRKRVVFILIVAGLLSGIVWLVGVGVFRQAVPKATVVVASSTPPTTLNSASDYLALGDYDFDQGRYDQSIADYSRALELNPNFAEAYNSRAYAYMTKQDYAHALPDLDRAIQLRPDYINALMNRGDIHNYYYQIDFDSAVRDYDRVIALDPTNAHHTSVCGHRMLAMHHGWNITIFFDILTRGTNAGCPVQSPGY